MLQQLCSLENQNLVKVKCQKHPHKSPNSSKDFGVPPENRFNNRQYLTQIETQFMCFDFYSQKRFFAIFANQRKG